MLVSEDYVVTEDNGKSYCTGDSGVYEPYTDNVRRLFDSYQREYGPCRSSIYVDGADGKAIKVGWVFAKRKRFEDCKEVATFETWVTFHEKMPTRTIEHHYMKI